MIFQEAKNENEIDYDVDTRSWSIGSEGKWCKILNSRHFLALNLKLINHYVLKSLIVSYLKTIKYNQSCLKWHLYVTSYSL